MAAPTKSFATTADVEAAISRTLSTPEINRAAKLIILASMAVTTESNNYRFAPGDYTLGRQVRTRQIILPCSSVGTTVSAIRSINQSDGVSTLQTVGTHYNVRGKKIYVLSGITSELRFSFLPSDSGLYYEIDIVVTTAIPSEIVAVVAGIVASTMSDPLLASDNDIGGSYGVSRISSSNKVWLSASDKAIIKAFRVPKTGIDLIG